MSQFLASLGDFLMNSEIPVNPEQVKGIYILSSGLFGLLFILVDIILIKAELIKESLFKLKYNDNKGKQNLFVIIVWTLGAAMMGYLSTIFNLAKMNVQSCAIIGLSWLILFTNLIYKLREPSVEQSMSKEEKD